MERWGADRRVRLVWGAASGGGEHLYRRTFPFRRHWPAIAGLAVFDAIFLWPAITTFQQALHEWRQLEGLHDLVGASFLTLWLLGWSMAPLVMTLILLAMLFGRERIAATPDRFEVVIGLPFAGVGVTFDPAEMHGLRRETPAPKSGRSWRGPHLAFDHDGKTIAFGIDVDAAESDRLIRDIEAATGGRLGAAASEPDSRPPAEPAFAMTGGAVAADRLPPRAAPETAPAARPPGHDAPPEARASLSILALVAANLVPVFGAAFLGWKLSDVMVLYWAESAIIGFYNLLKIVRIGRWTALFAGPFFVGHYGGFMAVHFLFVYAIFVQGADASAGDDLGSVGTLFRELAPALLALFVSHGLSFFQNFLGRREYEQRTVRDQMTEPYARIVFMHLVLIIGGGIALVLGEPTLVILGVIALKIVFDLRAHRREHLKRREQ